MNQTRREKHEKKSQGNKYIHNNKLFFEGNIYMIFY